MAKETFRWRGPVDSFFGISVDSAEEVVDFLKKDDENEAYISISSPGGSFDTAQTIIETLSPYKSRIKTEIVGIVASAGTHIAMTIADKVFARGKSRLMIHNASAGFSGTKEDFEKVAEQLAQVDNILVESIQEKSGLSKSKIEEYMKNETFFTSEEALKLKLIDEILETDESFTENQIDLAIVAYLREKENKPMTEEEVKKGILQAQKELNGTSEAEPVEEVKTEPVATLPEATGKINTEMEKETVTLNPKEIKSLDEARIVILTLQDEVERLRATEKEYSNYIQNTKNEKDNQAIEDALARRVISKAKADEMKENFKRVDEPSAKILRDYLRGLSVDARIGSSAKRFSENSDVAFIPTERLEEYKALNKSKEDMLELESLRAKMGVN